jgi:hypothetical protein
MIRSHRVRSLIVVAAVVGAFALVAEANPDALVPSLAPPGNWQGVQGSATDVFVHIDYEYEIDRSSITRERVGDPSADPNGPLTAQKDLVFHQYRHTVIPKVEVGLLHDTWIYAAMPIVITQSRELKFDSGVDASTSSTFGYDPANPGANGYGLLTSPFDAQAPSTPPPAGFAFRGVDRHGLDQLNLGFGVAPMNQRRDDTKPTWKIGAEIRIPIGRVQRFDPTLPGDNTAVGAGAYEMRLWTTFDRRLGWAEPWVELFWQAPVGYTDAALFKNPGFGATNTGKQQQAGVFGGFEVYAVDDKDHNRISLDLGARAIAHFEGRDYSELWEVFAYSGHSDLGGPLALDADPTTAGNQSLNHPGISNFENYLETAARIALRGELGTHVRFAVLGDMVWKTDHVISFADAGVDKSGNDLVDPNTAEVNPLHVDRIDLVGHRYHSVDNFGVIIGVQGMVLF